MITGILLLVIGLVMLILAINTFIQYKKVSRRGITTEGTVEDFQLANYRRYKYPVIRFITDNGQSVTRTYKVGTPRNTYQLGSKIPIVYDPNNPTNFFIKASFSTTGPIVMAIFSLLILMLGIYLTFYPYSFAGNQTPSIWHSSTEQHR